MSNDWFNLMVLGWHLHIGPWFVKVGYNPYHKDKNWQPSGRIKLMTAFGRTLNRK